jgi:putative glycosyltransferase
MTELSVVATLYRSEAFLGEFYRRVKAAAQAVAADHEIVLVNDGSPDASLQRALDLQRADPRLRVADLSRNFGHHKAMMAGLGLARGRRVFLIDSDLEEDPELLAHFEAEMARTGADVVYGVQARRKGGLFERFSGWLFFKAFNLVSSQPIPPNLSTVRLMSRRFVDALLAHRERETVIAGLWALVGFEQVPVTVEKRARAGSSYDLGRRVAVFVDSVTSFSDRPLILIFYLGLLISALSGLAAAYLVVRRLFFGELLAGWPSLIVSVWLLGGMTLFCLGTIGIYVSKIFIETKQRPSVVIRQVHERSQ